MVEYQPYCVLRLEWPWNQVCCHCGLIFNPYIKSLFSIGRLLHKSGGEKSQEWPVTRDPLKNGPEWYVTCVTPCMRCYKLRLNLDFLMGSSLAFLQSHETPGYPNMGVIELWNLLDSVFQHTLHRILCLRLCISEEWRNSVFTMGSKPFFELTLIHWGVSHFLIFLSEIE